MGQGLKLKAQMIKLTKILDEELTGEVRARVLERVRNVLTENKSHGKQGARGSLARAGETRGANGTAVKRKKKAADKQQDNFVKVMSSLVN